MADWSLPVLGTEYTLWRQALDGRLVDAALMFDSASTSATNIPSGAKRWNSTSSKFEKYNGSTWSDLAPLYAINISGNAATATTCSGNAATATTCSGNAATATNASQLEGYAASYFQVALGFTPVNKAGDTMTGDLTLYRTATPTIGALFLGNSGARYLSYNGTAYTLPGAELIINGGTALRSNNAKTIGGTSLWGAGDIEISTTALGVGQTLTNYSSSGRSLGTTYYNTTKRPILWWISTEVTATLLGSGAVLISYSDPSPTSAGGAYLVPPGASYGASNAGAMITKWYELR